MQQQDSEKHLPAEATLAGAKTAPQRQEKQPGRDPADIQKKLKKLIMHMLRRIDPGLKRALQAAISCVAEAKRMPENHRNGIPGVEKPADKLRSGEGRGQKTPDAFPVPGEKGIKNAAKNRGAGDDQNAQAGFPGFFPDEENEKDCHQEEEYDPASGENDSDGQENQPGQPTKTERGTEEHQHESEEKKDRIGVRILEKPGLPPGNEEPALQGRNPTQQKREKHHDRGGIRHPTQQSHTLRRSVLFKKQDKQRKRKKLHRADQGHAAVRPPDHSSQMKDDNGHGRKKRSAVATAECPVAQQVKKQKDQHKADQRRAPGKKAAEKEGTDQKKPFQHVQCS